MRRLTPQEDKVDVSAVAPDDRTPFARYLGALLGGAHRRGSTRAPKSPWNAKQCARLVHRAVALAGVHEAMYLAYCDLIRP